MKKLLYIILLLPLWVNAQTNGTIQKTSATGTIRGSFGSLGLDTLPRVTGALVDGYILKYHAATNKWYASPDGRDSLGLYVKKTGDTMTGTLNGTDIVLSGDLTADTLTGNNAVLAGRITATGLNSTGQATLGSLNQGGKMNFVSGGTGAVGGTLGFSTNATTNILSLQNIQGLELTSTNSNGYVAVRSTGANGSINFRTGSNINGYVHPSGNWSFQNGGTYTDNGYRIDVNGTGRFTSALTANSFVKTGGTSAQFLMGNGTVQDTTQIQTVANFFPKGDTRYQTLANLSTDLTASATKYPSVNAVNTGLGLKQNQLNGTGIVEMSGTTPSYLSSTGTGNVVKATSPTLVTPNIGNATGGTLSLSGTLNGTDIVLSKNLYIPSSTSTDGVIYQNGIRLIHTYVGSTAQGRNFYAGRGAGNFTGDNYASTGVGDSVLARNTTGVSLTGVGTSVLSKNTTGYGNTSVGTVSMGENTTGFANSNLGWHGLLVNTTGSYNAGVGAEGMRSNTTGSHNSWLGFSAGYNTNYSYGVYLGNEAGYNAGKDSTLWIDVSATSNPLIYGDFSRRTLKFNASAGTEFTGNVTMPSINSLTFTGQSGALNGGYTFGGDINSTGITNNTRKYATFAVPHYANASAPMSMIIGDVASSSNNIYIGGNQASLNAATNIEFYAAATTTTATGTKQMGITSSGVNIANLAGTGTRMVVANNVGDVSTQAIPGGGGGSVTGVAVASANGLSGTSDGNSVVPTLTLSTTVNSPLLAGNGTAISAATTTGSGSTAVLATSPTLTTPNLGVATATALTITGTALAAQGMLRVETGDGLQVLGKSGSTNDFAFYSSTLSGSVIANPTGTLNTIFGGSISATNFSGSSSGTNTGDQDLSALAPLASPALTGNPTAPTQTAGDNSTKVATTAYTDAAFNFAIAATKQLSSTYTTTQSSTVGASILNSYTIPSAALSANGDRVDFKVGGKYANNANSKSIRVEIAGVNVTNALGTNDSDKGWSLDGMIIRESSTKYRVIINSVTGGTNATYYNGTVTDFSSGLLVETIAYQATTSGDITLNMTSFTSSKAP